MNISSVNRLAQAWVALLLSIALPAHGDDKAESRYDRLWRHAQLYDNPDSGFIQSFALSGRLQADYAWFDADEGDYDDARWRRFRFGFTSQLADDWTVKLEGDFDLNNSPGDLYQRLTDAHVDWQVGESTSLKILKHSAGFTLDGYTSSKKLLTPERNNLTNNLWFTAEYFTGISLSGKLDKRLSYKAGVFASDDSDEWGVTDASYFTLASASYDWALFPRGLPLQPVATGKLGTVDRPFRRGRRLRATRSLGPGGDALLFLHRNNPACPALYPPGQRRRQRPAP
jgi:phosphate-selective porin OprO/OprP